MQNTLNPVYESLGTANINPVAIFIFDPSLSGSLGSGEYRHLASSDLAGGTSGTNVTGSVSLSSGSQVGITGGVAINPNSATKNSNSAPSGVNGLILNANSARNTYFIQNWGSNLYVLEGSGSASTVNFSYILSSGSNYTDNAGNSVHRGQVNVSGGAVVSFIAWER